jgi:hypothetical protein
MIYGAAVLACLLLLWFSLLYVLKEWARNCLIWKLYKWNCHQFKHFPSTCLLSNIKLLTSRIIILFQKAPSISLSLSGIHSRVSSYCISLFRNGMSVTLIESIAKCRTVFIHMPYRCVTVTMVTIHTISFVIKKLCILPRQCIYVFRMVLTMRAIRNTQIHCVGRM